MINKICRQYRLQSGMTLQEIAGHDGNVKTIYNFEHDRSTNIRHFEKYLLVAKKRGEIDTFLEMIKRGL